MITVNRWTKTERSKCRGRSGYQEYTYTYKCQPNIKFTSVYIYHILNYIRISFSKAFNSFSLN